MRYNLFINLRLQEQQHFLGRNMSNIGKKEYIFGVEKG